MKSFLATMWSNVELKATISALFEALLVVFVAVFLAGVIQGVMIHFFHMKPHSLSNTVVELLAGMGLWYGYCATRKLHLQYWRGQHDQEDQ